MQDRLLFGHFFFALRQAGLKIGIGEWIALMEALASESVDEDMLDFYAVARAVLIKSETHFDTYDQVFQAVFGGKTLPKNALEQLLEWLQDPKKLEALTPEQIAALERLSLDQLRELFEQRLKEQTERHDGGNRWIGTGGTSPFGHGGANPAGVRVGGSGGGRSAIQIASARRFREYRNDRVLDVRAMAVALKKLRRLSRTEGPLELDIEASIDHTCRNAGELALEFRPPRKNDARVILLMDVGGSMEPYSHHVEQLFSAASSIDHWKRFESFAFHNCPYSVLEPGKKQEAVATAELIKNRPAETFLILVGDAYMAPSELTEPFGAIDYWVQNKTPGLGWLYRLRRKFPRSVWLNPIPKSGWLGYTIRMIGQLFPMFPLTVGGLEEAIDRLTKRAPDPLGAFEQLFPEHAARTPLAEE